MNKIEPFEYQDETFHKFIGKTVIGTKINCQWPSLEVPFDKEGNLKLSPQHLVFT